MKSIKTSILLLALGVATGLALILSGYNTWYNYNQTLETNTQYIRARAEELAIEIDGFLEGQKGYLEGSSQALYDAKDYSKNFMAGYTANMAKGNPYIIYTYFNTPTDEGHFTSSDGWIPPEGYSWQDRYWIEIVAKTDEIFIEPPSYDSGTGNIVTVLRRRIYDGQLYGMPNMAINLQELSKKVAAYSLPEDGYAFIINEEDKLVAYPDLSIFKDTEDEPLITDFIDNLDTSRESMDLDGYRYTSIEVQEAPWKVFLVIPLTWYQMGTGKVLAQNGIIFLFAVVFTYWIGIITTRKIVNPILELHLYAHSIGQGDYEHALSNRLVSLPNEIGEFAQVFERMRQAIQKRTEELTLAKTSAEAAKVEVQTSYMELQALNEQMIATEEALNHNYKELRETKDMLEYEVYHDHTGFYNEKMLHKRLQFMIEHPNREWLFIYVTIRELPFYRKTFHDSRIAEIDQKTGELIRENLMGIQGVRIYHISTGVYGLISELDLSVDIEAWLQSLNSRLENLIIDSITRVNLSGVMGIVGQDVLNDVKDSDQIISYGHIAAMKALSRKGKEITRFSEEMYKEKEKDQQLESALLEAIEDGSFYVVYQPKFDFQQGIVGAEALVRWEHDELGFISPGVFIPIAEKLGLIGKIDLLVLKQALNTQKLIKTMFQKNLIITSNLSIQDLMDDNYFRKIYAAVERLNLEADLVGLEITETAFASEFDQVKDNMKAYRQAGFHFHLDDFGSGYSSMGYLTEFPISVIKLDGSFVGRMMENEKSLSVVKSAIDLAGGLGLEFIAEGVETQEQYEVLLSMGCKYFQGYYFAKPMREDDLIRLIEEK